MANIHLIFNRYRNYSLRKSGSRRALAVMRDTSYVAAIGMGLDAAREADCILYIHDSSGRISDRMTPRKLTGKVTGPIVS